MVLNCSLTWCLLNSTANFGLKTKCRAKSASQLPHHELHQVSIYYKEYLNIFLFFSSFCPHLYLLKQFVVFLTCTNRKNVTPSPSLVLWMLLPLIIQLICPFIHPSNIQPIRFETHVDHPCIHLCHPSIHPFHPSVLLPSSELKIQVFHLPVTLKCQLHSHHRRIISMNPFISFQLICIKCHKRHAEMICLWDIGRKWMHFWNKFVQCFLS